MAQHPIVTPCPVYVDNVKVGDATQGSYEIDSGQDMIISDAGIAFSNGRPTCKMDIGTIIPRKGMKVRLFEALLQQKQVKVRIFIDSKFHSFDGVLKSGKGDWNFANGQCNGSFSFLGGTPEMTG